MHGQQKLFECAEESSLWKNILKNKTKPRLFTSTSIVYQNELFWLSERNQNIGLPTPDGGRIDSQCATPGRWRSSCTYGLYLCRSSLYGFYTFVLSAFFLFCGVLQFCLSKSHMNFIFFTIDKKCMDDGNLFNAYDDGMKSKTILF